MNGSRESFEQSQHGERGATHASPEFRSRGQQLGDPCRGATNLVNDEQNARRLVAASHLAGAREPVGPWRPGGEIGGDDAAFH